MNQSEFQDTFKKIVAEVHQAVVGQDEVVNLLVTAIMAEGHVILTGMPGLGRTLIAESIGRTLGLNVSRIQFTPDLLPTDVTGTEVVEMEKGAPCYRFIKGAVFANMVLADEINRSPARTQSSLLEAMQEKQVTVSGHTYQLEKPFLVIATQNNLDTEGVYQLPEAQLDRFLMQIEIDYPTEEDENGILDVSTGVFHPQVQAVVTPEKVIEMQDFARHIPVPKTVKEFASKLVRASRWSDAEERDERELRKKDKEENSTAPWWKKTFKMKTKKNIGNQRVARFVRMGASPRASQALLRAAKVVAIVKGRAYVAREDITAVAFAVLSHRVIPDHRAGSRGMTSTDVVKDLLKEVLAATAPKPTSSRMGSLLVSRP